MGKIGICIVILLLSACGINPANDVNGTGTIPAAPSGLTIASTSQITLSWTSSSGATSYNIYRGTASGVLSTKTLLASNITATTYTDTSVTAGTTYYYQVTAVNASGESAASNEVNGGTFAAAPSGLTITSTAPITLSWTSSSGATSYTIYRGTASGVLSTKALLASTITATTYTDTTATAGVASYYQVTAVNARGESAGSNEVTATPSL